MAGRDWYPNTMDTLAAWWENFIVRAPEFELKYAILGTKKTPLINAGAWIEYWVAARHTFDEMSTQLSSYFNTISGNDSAADPPAPIMWSLPGGTPSEVPPGIEKFIRDIRREVVGLTNYAKADGEAMGFESTAPQSINPNDVTPTIKVSPGGTGYMFAIVVANRAGSDSWIVQTRVVGGDWVIAGTYTGKSADITIPAPENAIPVQVEVRVQLRKSNANYGQLSQIATVTVNP